jgi:hypothetical protein
MIFEGRGGHKPRQVTLQSVTSVKSVIWHPEQQPRPPQSLQSHTTISTAYAPSPRVRALGAFIKSRWWAVLPSILAGGGSLISPIALIGDPFPRPQVRLALIRARRLFG